MYTHNRVLKFTAELKSFSVFSSTRGLEYACNLSSTAGLQFVPKPLFQVAAQAQGQASSSNEEAEAKVDDEFQLLELKGMNEHEFQPMSTGCTALTH